MRSSHRSLVAVPLGLGLAAAALVVAAPAQAAPPANDDLAEAYDLVETQTVDLAGATAEPGEDDLGCTSVERTVWYRFTAEDDGAVRLSTSAGTAADDDDTVLAVYTGPADGATMGDLTDAACGDDQDGDLYASATVGVESGRTYFVRLGVYPGPRGPQRVTLTREAVPPPANDDFADRQPLSGASGSVDGDNTAASAEPGDPVTTTYEGAGGRSVWYSWTAPTSGPVQFRTLTPKTFIDTTLGVYTGDGLGSLQEVASDDDAGYGAVWSRVVLDAVAGTTYAIVVDGFPPDVIPSGFGPFRLSWAAPPRATTTTVAVPKRVVAGERPTVRATVRSAGGGGTSGVVTFVIESLDVYVERTLDQGVATARLPRLPRGTARLVALYTPTAATEGSQDRVTIRVRPR